MKSMDMTWIDCWTENAATECYPYGNYLMDCWLSNARNQKCQSIRSLNHEIRIDETEDVLIDKEWIIEDRVRHGMKICRPHCEYFHTAELNLRRYDDAPRADIYI